MKGFVIFVVCLILICSGWIEAQVSQKPVHDTYICGQKEFIAGSKASIRVMVKAATSLADSVPVPGANVLITIDAQGELSILYEGKTGYDGNADVKFDVPSIPEGSYMLYIYTSSKYGKDKFQEAVQIKHKEKILLVTDKPLYQPSQTIHIRALSLQSMTLRPIKDKEILFEVEDSKGNKVFKKKVVTDEYGIAYTPFLLAEEVNTGNYRIYASFKENKTEKVVTVDKYVLPKFKVVLNTDKLYFLPGDVVKGKVQSDYFFGKPVSEGKVKLTASTFDVEFKDFFKVEANLGEDGGYGFEFRLPEYFVGQPLEQGKALLKIEAEVTDKAQHTEKKTTTLPVSKDIIRIAIVPEGGRLYPGVTNNIYVITSYPDGTPASTDVDVDITGMGKAKYSLKGKSDESGITTLSFVPKQEDLFMAPQAPEAVHPGKFRRGGIEGELVQGESQHNQASLSFFIKARDKQGNSAQIPASVGVLPTKDSILIHPGKSIYDGGETISLDLLSTFDKGTVYIDILKDNQLVLTQAANLIYGRGRVDIEASGDLFGTLTCHAYKLLEGGSYIRSTRTIYVQPRSDIKIAISPDKEVYRPGDKATIAFFTTDQKNKPVPAALGITIVDEAVYALQEMQPGLEKVYFTLEKEILEPRYQIKYGPGESLPSLIREETISPVQQKAAAILFSKLDPVIDYAWQKNPQQQRLNQIMGNLYCIFDGIVRYAKENSITHQNKNGDWGYTPELLKILAEKKYIDTYYTKDPLGEGNIPLDCLIKLDFSFSYDVLGRLETARKIGKVYKSLYDYWKSHKYKRHYVFWKKENKDILKDITLDKLVKEGCLSEYDIRDAWGNKMQYKFVPHRLIPIVPEYTAIPAYISELRDVDISSAGPDGKFDTADDVVSFSPDQEIQSAVWPKTGVASQYSNQLRQRLWMVEEEGMWKDRRVFANEKALAMPGKGGNLRLNQDDAGIETKSTSATVTDGSAAEPPRVREYFPETLLFEPGMITDKSGKANLNLQMADSITTWRLTANANSKNGLLGGTTSGIRVFQDFFVDIDFPVALTQNDEVSVPVAIFNYLSKAQTVRLAVEKEPWFELLDQSEKSVTMNPKEVGVVYFRVRAKDIGYHRLTVMAYGTSMSDAVRRQVEIVPDGKRIEQVINGKLAQTIEHELMIPGNSIPGASKILVKCYPGIGAVLVEGLEGLLRLPGG